MGGGWGESVNKGNLWQKYFSDMVELSSKKLLKKISVGV